MALWLISLLAIVSSVLTAPTPDSEAKITSYEFQPNTGDGSYKFSFETSDGTMREEEGVLKVGKDNKEYMYVVGYYSYNSEKGRILVNYEVDEDGYRLTDEYFQSVQLSAATLASLVGGGIGK